MAFGETVPIETVGDDDLPCDGELCQDQSSCICGLRLSRPDEVSAEPRWVSTVETTASQEPEQPGIEIYDREEALRQIDLLGGTDPHPTRRLSEADDNRLARLHDVVAHTSRRALLLPGREWHLDLENLREDCPPFAAVTGLIERAVALAIMSRTPLRLPPILLVGPRASARRIIAGRWPRRFRRRSIGSPATPTPMPSSSLPASPVPGRGHGWA